MPEKTVKGEPELILEIESKSHLGSVKAYGLREVGGAKLRNCAQNLHLASSLLEMSCVYYD